MEILNLSLYTIHIVLVLLIQVFARYFYHRQILNQCHHRVEEADVHKVVIERSHRQNEQLERNEDSDSAYLKQTFVILVFFFQNVRVSM